MDHNSKDKLGGSMVIMLVILPRFKSITKFLVPNCAACHLACAMKFSPNVIKQYGIPEKETIILWYKYEL